MNTNHSRLRLYSLQLCIILIWSFSWVIGKYSLHYLPLFYLIALRLSIATAIFFGLGFVKNNLILPNIKDIPQILLIGIFQFFLFTFLSLWGLKYIDAGNSAMLSYTTPIWVAFLTYLIFREPITKNKLFSVILGGIGILILVKPFGINWSNQKFLLGNFLLLLAAISWAIAILSAKYLKWHKKPADLVLWQFSVATLCALPICYFTGSFIHINWSLNLILAVLFLSIIATSFGFLGMVIITKELPVITTSLCLLGVPFFSLIISHYLLNEDITINKSIAMLCILLAIVISIYEDHKKLEIQNN